MKLRALVIVAVVFAAGCASAPPPQNAERLFADARFAAPSAPVDAAQVFALSPAMRAYLDQDVARLVRTRGRQQALFEALYDRGQLKLEYDAAGTRNAAEAFEARAGNCLSLVIMTAAFAKDMGLDVRYQNVFGEETWGRSGNFYLAIGHVNLSLGRRQVEEKFGRNEPDTMTIDFLPPGDLRGLRTWVIDEATIVAMYFNNRAVESLTAGQLDDAYWYAREAIVTQPRFMSAYNTLGVVYENHGDLAEAQRALEFILDREPANTRAMSNLALVLRERGHPQAAAVLDRRLAEIEPNPPFGYFKRGQEAMARGDYKAAKELFTREVERAAYYHEFHFWLALADIGLGDMEGARRHVALALENSTTRADHDLYAAKLSRLEGTVPVRRR